MKTLTQINEEETATKDRARRFESLTNEASTLRNKIEFLAKDTRNTDALDKMLALVPEVPGDLETRSRQFASGGEDVRTLLNIVLSNAVATVRRRCEERDAALLTARTKLAAVEQQLTEFE